MDNIIKSEVRSRYEVRRRWGNALDHLTERLLPIVETTDASSYLFDHYCDWLNAV